MTDIRFTREQLLEIAKASPVAVAAHDRQAWISLFSSDYCVEDPVGAKPHQPNGRKQKPLENFYDTFIAPNDIVFHAENDIVTENTVLRDVTIELQMGKGVQAWVPMHLIYEIDEENGNSKISGLRAYWELWPMVKQVLGKGFGGLIIFSLLGFRMLKIQGIGGVLGFVRGFAGIHKEGKRMVTDFQEAFNNKDGDGLKDLFGRENEGIYISSIKKFFAPESFLAEIQGQMSVNKILSAGYFVSCTFKLDELNGIGLFKFHRKTKKIQNVELYFELGR